MQPHHRQCPFIVVLKTLSAGADIVDVIVRFNPAVSTPHSALNMGRISLSVCS